MPTNPILNSDDNVKLPTPIGTSNEGAEMELSLQRNAGVRPPTPPVDDAAGGGSSMGEGGMVDEGDDGEDSEEFEGENPMSNDKEKKEEVEEGGGDSRGKERVVEKVMKGHNGSVLSVAWSPSGDTLVSGSSKVILWDTNGKELKRFEGHSGGVYSVSFSPDGRYVASGSRDNALTNFVQDTLYLMMLGDYDPDDFPDTYTSLMSFLFMFLVVVVMMNVLITIVSDSYDNTMVRSNELFWRARLELVAGVSTTFKNVLSRMPTIDYEWWYEYCYESVDLISAAFFQGMTGKPLIEHPKNAIGEALRDDDIKAFKWGLRCCCFPFFWVFLIPMLLFHYAIALPLKWKVMSLRNSDIKLDLDKSRSGDDWAGSVLDIVKRVNNNTNNVNSKMQSEIASLSDAMVELKSQHAAVLELLTREKDNDKNKDV